MPHLSESTISTMYNRASALLVCSDILGSVWGCLTSAPSWRLIRVHTRSSFTLMGSWAVSTAYCGATGDSQHLSVALL